MVWGGPANTPPSSARAEVVPCRQLAFRGLGHQPALRPWTCVLLFRHGGALSRARHVRPAHGGGLGLYGGMPFVHGWRRSLFVREGDAPARRPDRRLFAFCG